MDLGLTLGAAVRLHPEATVAGRLVRHLKSAPRAPSAAGRSGARGEGYAKLERNADRDAWWLLCGPDRQQAANQAAMISSRRHLACGQADQSADEIERTAESTIRRGLDRSPSPPRRLYSCGSPGKELLSPRGPRQAAFEGPTLLLLSALLQCCTVQRSAATF